MKRVWKIFAIAFFACAVAASCEKEDVKPDGGETDETPEQPDENPVPQSKIVITQQPVGDTIFSSPVVLRVKAADEFGGEVSYAWFLKGKATVKSTKDSLVVRAGNAGEYFCRIATEGDTCFTDTVRVRELDYKYYGSELYSRESFTYGRFEVRMKFLYSPGCISSMFLYYNGSDQSRPGKDVWNEIDIEFVGKDTTKYQTNIITGTGGGTGNTSLQNRSEGHVALTPPDAHTDFHTYTIEWTPDYVAWFLDGVEVRKDQVGEVLGKLNGAGTAVEDQVAALVKSQSLRFNVWCSDATSWVGPLKNNRLPAAQHIDYVQVWSYDTETKEFVEKWKDDFDSFNSSRWSKGNWEIGVSKHKTENVVVENGECILKLVKEPIYK